MKLSREATRRRALVGVVLVGILLPGQATLAQSGQADGPVSPDSADAIRDSLVRPPPRPPFDAVDAVALPFRILILPLRAVGYGFAELAGFLIQPNPKPVPIVEKFTKAGFRAGVGSIGPRSGVALRLGYSGLSPLFVESAVSIRLSQRHRLGVLFESPQGQSLEVAYMFWRNSQPYFWGIGIDSNQDEQTNFLWDQQTASLAGTIRSRIDRSTVLVLSGVLAYEDNRVDEGRSRRFPTIQDDPEFAALYGVSERTKYARAGISAGLDLTYASGLQRRGLYIEAGYQYYAGVDDTDSDFRKIDAGLFAYLPLNQRQQLAFQVLTEANRNAKGEGVPFTHLAALGSEQGGRAYHQLRFRDQAMAALMVEWRWEAWRELHERARIETFIFYDTGSVAKRVFDIRLRDMKRSLGVGWRFVTLKGGAFVNYLAFGDEGFRFRIQFSSAF